MTLQTKKTVLLLGIVGATILGFQNCSNVNFEKDPNAPAMDYRFESVSPSDIIVDNAMGVEPVGGDGQAAGEQQEQPVVDQDKDDVAYPVEDQKEDYVKDEEVVKDEEEMEEVVEVEDKKNGKRDEMAENGKKNEENSSATGNQDKENEKKRDVASNNGQNLVECQLIESKELIVLAEKFQSQRSNSSKTRVCMSEQACLTLVNAHVAARDGKLVGAKTTEGSTKQCTKAFNGSKGTCNNADALTDAEVVELLAELAK